MSSKAAEMLGHPPGLKFRPDEDELVEFFLLPRVRGEPCWFPGVVVIDDDTAANTHPTKLLERHGLAGDEDAYFFVRTSDAAARQDRHCAGGGRWVSQRPVPNGACIGGQKVQWRRVNLNLQPSRGKSGGGSSGWVMHEYSLMEPPCPFLKICHVTFSGHGKDAKRVPAGEAGCHAGEPAPKRARVDVTAAANSGSSTCVYGSTAPAMDQGYGAYFPIDQGMQASNQQLLGGAYYLPSNAMPYTESKEITWSIPFAESAACADVYLEQVPLTEQHQPTNQQLQLVQSYSAACAYGSTTTEEPQHDGLDEQEKQFWRSIGIDTDNLVV
ncbi:unnamed protein product [Urochloa decumbens]|uniref:NAC domain-containing protein n=1 Tax=Urochloa decumbens TaxID=240449 RepID=A0ABC9DF57_9POAL